MEFEDQEEQEEEMEVQTANYDLLGNSSRVIRATSPHNGNNNSSNNNNNNNNNEAVTTSPTATTLFPSPHQQQQQRKAARYRECQKNHAVGIGGHAVDGCGEFLAAGAEGTLDALKCAACNCHRNFHRKETATNDSSAFTGVYFPHQHPPYYRTPAGILVAPTQHRPPPPPPLALPSTTSTHSREFLMDQEDVSNQGFMGSTSARKRFRTKFTQDQKDKMLGLAEKLGWRIQKHDEAVVQQFCNETGVKRHVLKVWMHNNKHTVGKKP